ncbi:MAG TPA: NADH-quinone oxidoreductase subunit NuoK [Coriobacteriia bacterium]
MIPASWFLALGAIVFLIALFGFLTRRSLIQSLMCLELMLSSVNLTFVTFGRTVGDPAASGVTFALFAMVVGAAEIGVGLALVLVFFREGHANVTSDDLDILKG